MRRYLKSMAILALIAALLMGCNTIPDTPDVPEDVKEPDLSTITKLEYELHPLSISPHNFGYIAKLPFEDRFYPLNNGSWAMKSASYTVSSVDGILSGKDIQKKLAIQYVDIIDASGAMPCLNPTTSTGENNPLYGACTLAMAFDTGDLLTCLDINGKYVNHKKDDVLNDIRENWVLGELIRDNRFSRIALYQSEMTAYYYPDMFSQQGEIIPKYALFDRFTRLTEFKYCELYASGDIFLGLYVDDSNILYSDVISETGEILRSEAADLRKEYPEEKNDYEYDGLTVKRDKETKLYYYVNAKGEAVCDPAFTECTSIKNGTAVVRIANTLYLLKVKQEKTVDTDDASLLANGYQPAITPYKGDLSKCTSITYKLFRLTADPNYEKAYYDLARKKPTSVYFNDCFYPLANGCWAYVNNFLGVSPIGDEYKQPVNMEMQIIYPDGSMPHTYRLTASGNPNPLYRQFTMAMALDTGELLSCSGIDERCIDLKPSDSLGDTEERWVVGDLIRDNRFSRIANWNRSMEPAYQKQLITGQKVAPTYALFDRFERLTEFKYRELYASKGVFIGLYYDEDGNIHSDVLSETGEVLRSWPTDIRPTYPEEKNNYGFDGLTVAIDRFETGLLYYKNAYGKAVCEPAFTYCTNIKNGTAIVMIKDELYMLVVTSAE